MRAVGDDPQRAVLLERGGGAAQGSRGIGHVVDQDAGPVAHVADDVHHLRLVRLRTALVDDREVGVVEPLGEGAGAHHAAHVRRDHHQVRVLVPPDVPERHRRGVDVVDRYAEEALYLIGMEVHGQHPVGAGDRDHVGDDLCGDRDARGAGAAVLAGIAVVRHHGGDAARGCALERIGEDEQLHQVLIDRSVTAALERCAGRLDHERILSADRVDQLHHDLAVAEAIDHRLAERHVQMPHDLARQRGIGGSREHDHRGQGVRRVCAEPVDPVERVAVAAVVHRWMSTLARVRWASAPRGPSFPRQREFGQLVPAMSGWVKDSRSPVCRSATKPPANGL